MARGSADMHKVVPVTLIERQYSGHPDAAPFMSLTMPPIVDFQRSDKNKDGSMRKEQKTLGLAAMSLTAGLSHLETGAAQVKEALDKIPEGEIKRQLRKGLKTMTETALQPLGHSLRFLASWFNEIGSRRHTLAVNAIRDPVLKEQVAGVKMGFDSIFETPIEDLVAAGTSRRQQDLLNKALKAGFLRQSARSRSPVRRDREQRRPEYHTSRRRGGGGSRGRSSARGGHGARGSRRNRSCRD